MARRSEQGNVLGFVLVGVLLAALLVGGIYFVRHNVAKPSQTSDSTPVSKPAENKDVSTNSSNDTNSSDQQLKDALAAQNAAEEKAKQQQQANSSTTDTDQSRSTASTAAASNLPKTGPADGYVPLLGAVLLTGVGLSYVRSRKLI